MGLREGYSSSDYGIEVQTRDDSYIWWFEYFISYTFCQKIVNPFHRDAGLTLFLWQTIPWNCQALKFHAVFNIGLFHWKILPLMTLFIEISDSRDPATRQKFKSSPPPPLRQAFTAHPRRIMVAVSLCICGVWRSVWTWLWKKHALTCKGFSGGTALIYVIKFETPSSTYIFFRYISAIVQSSREIAQISS